MPAHFRAVIPTLVVDSVEPTRTFFTSRLGFAAVTEVVHDGVLGFVVLRRDGATIMVQSVAHLRFDLGERYVPGPYHAQVTVVVDDVQQLVPEVVDADIVLPLRRTGYGMHEIGVREPGGNVIVFASPLAR
jgi:catechol 2,3-dioxygenase-like lactoylglutathione lyase family enzyme